jgi:hypothetical protein
LIDELGRAALRGSLVYHVPVSDVGSQSPRGGASVDHAAHLRSVHFSVVAISLGLLIAIVVDRSREVETAYSDIVAINHILRTIDNDWLQRLAERAVRSTGHIVRGDPQYYSCAVYYGPSALPHDVILTLPPQQFTLATQPPVNDGIAPQGHYEPVRFRNSIDGILTADLSLPRRLDEFKSFWNALDNLHSVRVARHFASDVMVQTAIVDDLGMERRDIRNHRSVLKPMKEPAVTDESIRMPMFPLQLQPSRSADSSSQPQYVLQGILAFLAGTPNVRVVGHVTAPADCVTLAVLPQFELATAGRRNWRSGRFQETFPDLEALTSNYDTIPLQDVERVLLAERLRGGQQIEFVGTKIPAQAVSNIGFLMIAVVQVYFLLHLRNFQRKVGYADPALEVAWIALYPDRLSHAVVTVSLCVPPAVIAVLWRELWLLNGSLLLLAYGAAAMVISCCTTTSTLRVFSTLWQEKLS